MTERDACLRLALASGLGGVGFLKLLERFGSPTRILSAPSRRLGRYAGAVRDANRLEETAAHTPLICWVDQDYPPLLREIPDPPLALWYRGRRPAVDVPRVSIVGTRKATAYGRRVAADMARQLSRVGIEVVSGLALGIDGAAHRGALEGGSGTLAVMGTGIDRVFPALHREVAGRVEADGSLLTEFAPGAPAHAGHFPRRNRIISGLSLGTVVVEAGERGGALITARVALDQNREVFAVPGDLGRKSSSGTNRLIARGEAQLVSSADEVLEALAMHLDSLPWSPSEGHEPPSKEVLQAQGPRSAHDLEDDQGPGGALQRVLTHEPQSLDSICEASGLSVSRALVGLLDLEFAGTARSYPGKRYGLA